MATKATVKKVTKKAAPKTSVKVQNQVQSAAVVEKSTKSAKNEKMSFKMRRSYLILAIVIVVLGILLYAGRGLFVAAVVNGQPISRLSIIQETEKQSGKQALETIVRNTLIEQEARRENVSVSDAEVNGELKKVEAQVAQQGQKLDDVLVMQGMTRQDLIKILKLNLLIRKMIGNDVKVSDQEVSDYLTKNKDMLPQGQSDDQLKKLAVDRIKQDKLNEKTRTWLTDLQTKAKIIYFVQY
ncbi:MAG TPA: SurA N-terminal domain-containing protein [Patescibacteria group bacterium]